MTRVSKPARSTRPIEHHIYVIRGQKVMLDADLAALYAVETKMLNRAVQRNPERFPEHFMFQLTAEETAALRFQTGTSKTGRGGRRYLPYVFTEHGVVMLSAVLNSARAVQMSIMVVQAFVRLREMIAANKDLAARVDKLEHGQRQTASIIEVLVDEIEHMKALPPPSKRKIGFDL
jgi:ORF6N domain-containing protein